MKKLLLTLLISLMSMFSHAEDNWTIDDSNWIYANGTTVNGHKFGFAKDKGRCDENLMFISWSTYANGLEEFEGQDVKVYMDFDGKVTHTTLDLISTYKFGEMTLAVFSNVVMPEEFLNIIRNSKNLIVAFSTKNDLTKVLDIQNDTFNIEGFTKAYDKTQSQCME